MPIAQAGGATAFLDGELVVAGGTAWKGETKLWLDAVQLYNPSQNSWRQGPALPHSTAYGAFISSAEGLEMLGGTDGQTVSRQIWKLNPSKTQWTHVGDLPTNSVHGQAVRVGEDVFLFGGCADAADLTQCSDAVWRRDNKQQWRKVATLPNGPVALSAVAASGGFVYVLGGCSMPSPGVVRNHAQVFRFNPRTMEWKTMRSLPTARRGLSAVTAGQQIYVIGGYADASTESGQQAGFSHDVLVYHPQTDTYTLATPLPIGLLGIEFVVAGERLYGAGGEDRARSRSARLFTAPRQELEK